MKQRVIAFLVCLCMVLITPLGYAAEGVSYEKGLESYIDENLGISLKRTIDKNGVITVIATDLKSMDTHIIINSHGKITVDGVPFTLKSEQIPVENDNHLIPLGEWGAWNYGYETFSTGGLTTVIIAGMILAFCPWVGAKIVAVVAAGVAGKYDTLGIRCRIRYRTDGDLTCYERYTSFYGDGRLIYGPYRDARCSYQ